MPVLRSTLLSAGTPGYGTLLSLIERAGLYAVVEQATTPQAVHDPLLRSEGADIAAAITTFERVRAAAATRAPELPRPPHVLRYLAAIEEATAPLSLSLRTAPAIERPSAPTPAPVQEPEVTTARAARAADAPIHVVARPIPEDQASSATLAPTRRIRRGVTQRAQIDEQPPIDDLLAHVETEAGGEPTADEWAAFAALSETLVEPTPDPQVHHPNPRQITPPESPTAATESTEANASETPRARLSVDEIIARAFGRRPAPALPSVEAAPSPEHVSQETIAAHLANGAYASAPRLYEMAEIDVDQTGIVQVRRGSGDRLPAYLPALANVRADVGFFDDQLVIHDLLSVDGRDLRGEPLWQRYVLAMECGSVAGIAAVPLLPHPRTAEPGEQITVRDLRATYGRSGSWVSAD